MSITGNWERRRLSRRDFLAISGMGATALALGTQGLLLPSRALAASYYPSKLSNPFTLGVASGDPQHDGVVLWTRLAPSPLNGGGMGRTGDVYVDWEVATGLSPDGKLQEIVLSSLKDTQTQYGAVVKQDRAVAYATQAHSVHLEVGVDTAKLPTTLERTYYYRFTVSDSAGNPKYESPIGRTKTTPLPGDTSLAQMKFAFASCQEWESGFYQAYRHMANLAQAPETDLDCVVFLGDYIYEYGPSTGWPRSYKTAAAKDLKSYRNRHAEYKTDKDLQAAHAKYPWMCSWDDHEVYNNYAGAVDANRRRDAAYQAYFEHMPLRPSRVLKGNEWRNINLYGQFAYGDLAQFCVLDTRQFRTDQPCDYSVDSCEERFYETQTTPGGIQEDWLKQQLTPLTNGSWPYRWNVLANQVIMMEYDHSYKENEESYYMDGWDGYVACRNRLFKHVAERKVPNLVTVTGDMHGSFTAELKDDFRRENYDKSNTLGFEFTGTSISSWLTDWWKKTWKEAQTDNPHVKYVDANPGGYVLCTLTNGAEAYYQADYYRAYDYENSDSYNISKAASFRVQNGALERIP